MARMTIQQQLERIHVRLACDGQPVRVDGRVDRDRLEEAVATRARKERQPIGCDSHFSRQVLFDSLGVLVEAPRSGEPGA